jgi:hypothetical protein
VLKSRAQQIFLLIPVHLLIANDALGHGSVYLLGKHPGAQHKKNHGAPTFQDSFDFFIGLMQKLVDDWSNFA